MCREHPRPPILLGGLILFPPPAPNLADAIVDRLLERGEIIHLKGKSYRTP